jgi:hypothetical protein
VRLVPLHHVTAEPDATLARIAQALARRD